MELKDIYYINKLLFNGTLRTIFYDPTSENGTETETETENRTVISVIIRLFFKERKESRQRKERNTKITLTKL